MFMFCSTSSPLAALRSRIAHLEGVPAAGAAPLGLAPVDSALPGGGLVRGALHEVLCGDPSDGAALAFLGALAGRLADRQPVLWVAGDLDLFPPGLLRFGCSPDCLLMVRCRGLREALWAIEEGLRSAAVAAVIGDADPPDFAWSRRLQLAAVRAARPLLLLRRHFNPRESTAAASRWRVASVPSAKSAGGGPGFPRWRLDLLKCRGGQPRSWTVDFDAARCALREVRLP